MLAVLKPVATGACLATGATGGLLTPALATGAMLGGLTGGAWSLLWPGAMIAAAAVLATAQKAPLCAIVLHRIHQHRPEPRRSDDPGHHRRPTDRDIPAPVTPEVGEQHPSSSVAVNPDETVHTDFAGPEGQAARGEVMGDLAFRLSTGRQRPLSIVCIWVICAAWLVVIESDSFSAAGLLPWAFSVVAMVSAPW